MPRSNYSPKLDRRIRLIVYADGTRVAGIYVRGPKVLDDIVWAGKPSGVTQFDVTEHSIQVEAKATWIVRAFRLRQRGAGKPAVHPFPAGLDFRVVDSDDRQFYVETVNEIGRERFLELAVDSVTTPVSTITFSGGVA